MADTFSRSDAASYGHVDGALVAFEYVLKAQRACTGRSKRLRSNNSPDPISARCLDIVSNHRWDQSTDQEDDRTHQSS